MNGNRPTLLGAVRGPVILITIGVLFALNNFTQYGFQSTWPVILIVVGLLSLAGRGLAPATPVPPPYAPAPGYQPPYVPPEPGGYRQSPYVQPPAPETSAPAKGGFGTSAPSRGSEPPPATGGEA